MYRAVTMGKYSNREQQEYETIEQINWTCRKIVQLRKYETIQLMYKQNETAINTIKRTPLCCSINHTTEKKEYPKLSIKQRRPICYKLGEKFFRKA